MALIIAMVMAAAMAFPAMAATIEVQHVLDGETYTAYKILNYRDSEGADGERAVSYYLTSEEYQDLGAVLKVIR